MTEVGSVYGEAMYTLAREENVSEVILQQLKVLDSCFAQEPDFARLLAAPNLPKTERCQILEACFRGKVDSFVLNFLKILTEKGYMRHFSGCVETYRKLYNQENGILTVTAVTAYPMTDEQKAKLTDKLRKFTGKRIALTNKLEPAILGGMRLDYNGKRIDGTVSHRLDAVGNMLRNTVL